MKIFRNILFALLILQSLAAVAHSGKARFHVFIETDGGLDDYRAISLLLASKEVEVIGIYCTDGVLLPEQTAAKISSMLQVYHHEGIPVGYAKAFLKEAPSLRERVSKLEWGIEPGPPETGPDEGFPARIIQAEEEPVYYICLASLHSLAKMDNNKDPALQEIERILWFDISADIASGFNYKLCPESAEKLIHSGIDLRIVGPGKSDLPQLDDQFWTEVSVIPSRYAAFLAGVELSEEVREDLPVGRTHLWDELVPLFLHHPELFDSTNCKRYAGHQYYKPVSDRELLTAYKQLLAEKAPDYKILDHLPQAGDYYQDDFRPVSDSVFRLYGEKEWRAGIIACEIHGHIGIYAIIGVKMGIRARDYFNIGLDDLMIESHAGTGPPISCMNDGLQVSTGSTLGHGLIEVPQSSEPRIEALFNFKDQKVVIRLKEDIAGRIRQEVGECVRRNGGLTPQYWEEIRVMAFEYWLNLDRNKIFTIEKI